MDQDYLKNTLNEIKSYIEDNQIRVDEAIEKIVDKKIQELRDEIQNWRDDDLAWREEETGKRLELEKRMEPLIELFTDASRTKKMVVYLLGGLASIGGFYLLIREIFFK